MTGFVRTFYIVPKEPIVSEDFFETRLVQGRLGTDFSVLYVPALANHGSVITATVLALTKRDSDPGLVHFMDGSRNLSVVNPASADCSWMFDYLQKLCVNFSRLVSKTHDTNYFTSWKEE
ncbi:protein LH1 [Lizard adenovirus 2]|uniref:Protein LH1 n=1 Tax=Lizard adenovirus 2 TaxID=874272 RepID=A0A076FUL2_9ADEN|nr:protein LH1 [Lizard adenovirus 2]AII22559.1 protein LH1 [Lizard adenovirus 2]